MRENEILAEIHRVREEIARECQFDLDEFFARLRRTQAKAEAEGWKVVDLSAQSPKAEPAGANS